MRTITFLAFLVLVLGVHRANAATRTWTGSGPDNHLMTAANWAEGVVPVAADDIVFPAMSAQYSVFCDLFYFSNFQHSVTFEAGNYSFTGYIKTESLTLNGGAQDLGQQLWA